MLGRGFPCIPIKDHFLLLMTQRSKLFPKSPSIVRPSQFHFQLLRSLDRISFFLRRFILLFDSSEKQWPRRPLPIVSHLFLAPSHRDEKSVHKEYPASKTSVAESASHPHRTWIYVCVCRTSPSIGARNAGFWPAKEL